ncbi:Superfamily II helicase [Marinobacter santoriniensis NKSG1]|uniref:Superfamily II helicase n=1 Tax=Marinobacter santoriniensis NKSG1 TaxID=1288826 RepID=M7CU59_9GAMM|nr:DEAD/DEAH box helicase [Marinobacter santoriniensis]EMP57121.1 Superfamily II helicase [Marinobacter santoriniensis NKSG1]
MSSISLKTLRNTNLSKLYFKLLRREDLDNREQEAILKIALLLLNAGDENCQELGYRIVVLYSNHFSDYKPLYDIAINKGFIPVAKSIEKVEALSHHFQNDFFSLFLSSFSETYRSNGIYQTSEQASLSRYFSEEADRGVAVVAPTSYGKSELFVRFCNSNAGKTIAIIVPTKALLSQMKRRVLHGSDELNLDRKIITHPEMYNEGDRGFIAILTQERLLRILQDDAALVFDYVFVDEAHNLLSGDSRNTLLAKVITLLGRRSKDTSFSFLTPFLVNSRNLHTRFVDPSFSEFRIGEHLKTERYYAIDLRDDGDRLLKLYDQYMNEFTVLGASHKENEVQFLQENSGNKNIVYLNSPPRLEKLAAMLSAQESPIDSDELDAVCEDISEFLHRDYGLLDCLRKGVIYHHGSVPDVVKLFIEELYSVVPSIRYIVSSSTLLEGVNIPAEKLFLLECKKGRSNLTASQFKNLVGRVCRFGEIFNDSEGSLYLLEPEIYVVASRYVHRNANVENFLRERVKVDKKIKDELKNVLLENTEITDKNVEDLEKAVEVLENLSPGVTGREIKYVETLVGKTCYLNNIIEFPILDCEFEISEYLDEVRVDQHLIDGLEELLDVIHHGFIDHIPDDSYRNLQRLREASAKRFYRMFLSWRMRNASFNEMIKRFLDYWAEIPDPLVYVDKWGDTSRDGSYSESWVNISEKSHKERVNLAIVRIKEEQDFLDNQIMKFVEILNDLEMLDEDFYKKIKYGTADEKKITMMKNGFSAGLASLLLQKYSNYVEVDSAANIVNLRAEVQEIMKRNNESRIFIFEAGFNTRG